MRQLKLEDYKLKTPKTIQPFITMLAQTKRLNAGKEPTTEQERIDKLVIDNTLLALSVAKTYMRRDVPIDDIFQEACIGLITAAQKYNPNLGFKFSSYAINWIRQSIMTGLLADKMIRIPANKYSETYKGRLEFEKFLQENQVDIKSLPDISDYETSTISMDTPLSDDSQVTFGDTFGNRDPEYSDDMVNILYAYIDKKEFGKKSSTIRMRRVLRIYLEGNLNDIPYGSIKDQIVYEFKVTPERARQLIEKGKILLQNDPFVRSLFCA